MIEFDRVSFRHPNGPYALRDINLRLEEGTVAAIVGENGAGKTTLVKHINGLLKPSSGRVKVFGIDTRETSVANNSKRVGIVFQNPDHQLFSDTVSNEILFGLRNFGLDEKERRERLEWSLDFFDLKNYRDTSPMMLSGGEKKRLCLASVLAWNPEVLILDEPTVGQDFFQKERLTRTILELNRNGKTIILVSHDIEFLWPLQPRVIAMSSGSIVSEGNASDVLSNDHVLAQANLLMPQLLELWKRLTLDGRSPRNVDEAAEILSGSMGG